MSIDEHRWQDMFQEIVQDVRTWRTHHPTATLSEIEGEMDRRLARLRAHMIADTAQERATTSWDADTDPPTCPDCGVPLHAKGTHSRTLQTLGGHDITLERTYGTCPQCGRGFFPPR
jgi:hypothetical protein